MGKYLQDIFNQPGDLRTAVNSYFNAGNLRQMRALSAHGFKKVLFSGMGSSNYCSIGAAIELNRNGFFASVVSAGELLHYETALARKDILLVLVSQSGESAEIVHLIEQLPENCTVAAITNNGNSTLGKRGNYTFLLNVPEEESVTTRTYLSSLLLADLLSIVLAGGDQDSFRRRAEKAIVELEVFLKKSESFTTNLASFDHGASSISVIGRGHSLSTVRAGALFLREVVKFPALDFDGGEFRHGPFEMVDESFRCIIIAPRGETHQLNIKLMQDIVNRGGRVILITNEKTSVDASRVQMAEFGDVDERLSPIVTIAPIQLLADSMAKANGVEAGKFRWGSKVTAIE